jgi:glycerol-3-phosphate dehydrogenase (NAD(P)+)
MKITIFGAGAFGTALGKILEEKGHTLEYYDPVKYPEKGLTSTIEGSEAYLLAVPSAAAPKVLLFLPHDKPLICASKGFLTAASFKPFTKFSVLSGGAFAADLDKKAPCVLTATDPFIKQLFETDWLKFDETTDKTGVLICGALKNIYAIGSGYWGLKYGTQDFDDFINSALTEMKIILQTNGADPRTVDLSCGLRDLVITCASPTSRNYDFGVKLKNDPELGVKLQKGQVKMGTVEGVGAIAAIPKTPSFVKPANTPILVRIIAPVNNIPIVSPVSGEEQSAA